MMSACRLRPIKQRYTGILLSALLGASCSGDPSNSSECIAQVERCTELARSGDVQFQAFLGSLYANGDIELSDTNPEALQWINLAAESGDGVAQLDLGQRHAAGDGVSQDSQEAIRWYHLSANQGNADAQYNLGVILGNGGQGVETGYAEAVQWTKLAAEQGHVQSQHDMAVALAYGMGMPKDDKESVRWLRMAADQAHVDSLVSLGIRSLMGRGFSKDEGEAKRLWLLAVEGGSARAQVYLDQLESSSAEQ